MRSSSRVLRKEDADQYVLPFEIQKFKVTLSEPAQGFINLQTSKPTGFLIDPLISAQAGIAEVHKAELQDQIEAEALEKVKEIQEQAFHEAYQLGLQEGTERAYAEAQEVLDGQITSFSQLLQQVENLKLNLTEFNEAQIVKLTFFLGSRLARKTIEEDPGLILETIKETVKRTQQDEKVKVVISPTDFAYLEEVKGRLGRDFDFLKRVEVEAQPTVTSGGCIIETNYGSIDATLETQTQRMWENLLERTPKIKDKIGA